MPTARRNIVRARRKVSSAKKYKTKVVAGKIIFVIFAIFLIWFFWSLYQSWKNSEWISGTRLTVAVGGQNPKIYSFNPQSKKLTQIKIPLKTQISVSGGMGDWLVENIWKLGEQEGVGGQLLADSLEKSLGLPIDAWIEETGESLFTSSQLGIFSSIYQAIVTSRAKTNLTFYDRLQILLQTSSSGRSGRNEVDLAALGVVKRAKLGGGEDGYVIIPDKAKIAWESYRDDLVFAESKKIIVINASTKAGLALEVTRVVSALGLRVIGTSSEKTDIEVNDCEVRGWKSHIESVSAERLAKMLGCGVRDVEISSPQDIELVLGERFAERY